MYLLSSLLVFVLPTLYSAADSLLREEEIANIAYKKYPLLPLKKLRDEIKREIALSGPKALQNRVANNKLWAQFVYCRMENRKDCDVLSSKYALLVGSRVIPFKARYMSRDLNDCEKSCSAMCVQGCDAMCKGLCAIRFSYPDRMEYESAMTSLINDTSIFSGLSQQSTEKFAPKIHVPFHESN